MGSRCLYSVATSRPLESAHVGGVGQVGDDNVYYYSGERLKVRTLAHTLRNTSLDKFRLAARSWLAGRDALTMPVKWREARAAQTRASEP